MTPLMDYTLRLLINTSENKIAYQNYISGSLVKKLIIMMERYIKNGGLIWSVM